MSFEHELTVSERLIWAGQRLDPEAPLYNMALAFDLAGDLDANAFNEAFRHVVESADALRTVWVEEGGQPRRVILDRVDTRVELLELPEAEVDDVQLHAMLSERTKRPFRLDEPLFDTCLVRRRPDRFIWYLNQHHLITDAWSVGVLYRRLATFYQAVRELGAGPVQVEDTEFPQYAAYADHQRGLQGSERLTQALKHWDQAGNAASRTLRLYGNESPGSGRTRRVRVRLGPERTAALRALAADTPFRALTREQSHFQVFATLLLAWLHRVSDQREVAIGCPWHNRPTAMLRDTVGLLIELYPLRSTLDEGETFATLGAKVARGTMDMLRHVIHGASASSGARGLDPLGLWGPRPPCAAPGTRLRSRRRPGAGLRSRHGDVWRQRVRLGG